MWVQETQRDRRYLGTQGERFAWGAEFDVERAATVEAAAEAAAAVDAAAAADIVEAFGHRRGCGESDRCSTSPALVLPEGEGSGCCSCTSPSSSSLEKSSRFAVAACLMAVALSFARVLAEPTEEGFVVGVPSLSLLWQGR